MRDDDDGALLVRVFHSDHLNEGRDAIINVQTRLTLRETIEEPAEQSRERASAPW